MLRLLLIALVVVNIALLVVQALRPPLTEEPAATAIVVDEASVPKIQLLEELEGLSGKGIGSAECFVVGPFETEADKAAAMRRVAPVALSIAERRTEAVVDRGVWVYLPVQPDYVTARNMALTMRDAGLGDPDVIMDGEWRLSVSLGYFSSSQNARRRAEEARSLGFPAETRVQQDIEPRYWIDYEQRVGAPYLRVSADGPITPQLHRFVPCARAPGPSQVAEDAAPYEEPVPDPG